MNSSQVGPGSWILLPGTCRWRHSERAPHPHPSRAQITSAWFGWGQKTEMKERDYWDSWNLWNRIMRNKRDCREIGHETCINVSSNFHLIYKLCTHRARLHEARQTILMGKRASTSARTGLKTSKIAARVGTPPGTPQNLVKQSNPHAIHSAVQAWDLYENKRRHPSGSECAFWKEISSMRISWMHEFSFHVWD